MKQVTITSRDDAEACEYCGSGPRFTEAPREVSKGVKAFTCGCSATTYLLKEQPKKTPTKRRVIKGSMATYGKIMNTDLYGSMNTIQRAENCRIYGSMNKILSADDATEIRGSLNEIMRREG